MRTIRCLALGCLLASTGCGFLIDLAWPRQTTVRLVNHSDFDVDVVLFYGDDQNAPQDVLTSIGTRMEFSLPPGASTRFSRDCDRLQAVVVDDARLRVVNQSGPDARSRVLRDGSDFDCRDTIIFTFDHSDAVIDFDVSVAVEKAQLPGA